MTNRRGWTPLYIASYEGYLDIVNVLLGAKAKVDKANTMGKTPLNIASWQGHLDIVQVLLDAEADVNMADKDSETPLFAASRNGHFNVVKALVDAKADVNIRNKDNYSAVYYASVANYGKIVSLLMHTIVDKYYPKYYQSNHAERDRVEEELKSAINKQHAARLALKGRPLSLLPPDSIGDIQRYLGGKRKSSKKSKKKNITSRKK